MKNSIPCSVGFIDLETLPSDAVVGMDLTRAPDWVEPSPEPKVVERRECPRNYKDKAKIATWEAGEDARELAAVEKALEAAVEAVDAQRLSTLEKWRKGSLNAYRGRIGLIAVALGEGDVHTIDCAEDEKAGLQELARMAMRWTHALGACNKRPTWVAHNGIRFDFPMVQLRALAHGSTILARRFHQEKAWDGRLVDTAEWWPTVGGWGKRFEGTKLDDICAHLGIERPDNPIDGSQVLDAYVEGRWDQVVAHGYADVRDLREVYRVLRDVRHG